MSRQAHSHGMQGPNPEGEKRQKSSQPPLVIVDMQRVFNEGKWKVPNFGAAKKNIERLIPLFDTVLFTQFTAPRKPSGAWKTFYEGRPDLAEAPAPGQGQESPWDLLIEPREDDIVVDSHQIGKWHDGVQAALGDGIDRIVCCGVATDWCVSQLVTSAADDGLVVEVVDDATAGVDAKRHDDALAIMTSRKPFIFSLLTDEVIEKYGGMQSNGHANGLANGHANGAKE